MTRPEIIRADTLDLQDTDAPSAQDHTHQTVHPAPFGIGPPAPHQDASLRHAAVERSAEQQYLEETWSQNPTSQPELNQEEQRDYVENAVGGHDGHMDEHRHSPNGDFDASADHADINEAEGDDALDDDMLDKISSSPSIEDEDIDFEFVYALHTFVATVEGQANATKGDTMVLLDDSNSYWWLVRVVKDSSIGYLPAEHIETPTERLARLNKHRNIDLSATMLGDNPERSKNPLKKAIRRRNAKMVQFSAPTYYDPPDMVAWSDNDQIYDDTTRMNAAAMETGEGQPLSEPEQGVMQDSIASEDGYQSFNEEPREAPIAQGSGDAMRTSFDDSRDSDEAPGNEQDAANNSRNGVIRNTDSFFKDNSAEPKKISLTPTILKEGSAQASMRPRDSAEQPAAPVTAVQTGTTPSTLTKTPSPTLTRMTSAERLRVANTDKTKLDKAKKDKKPGMLSGLFKRKEKKIKVDEAAGGIVAKTDAGDLRQTSSPIGSGTISPVERTGQAAAAAAQKDVKPPARTSSVGKLTKPAPGGGFAPTISLPPPTNDSSLGPDGKIAGSPTKAFDSMLNPNRPVGLDMQEANSIQNDQQTVPITNFNQRADAMYEEIRQGPYERSAPNDVTAPKQSIDLHPVQHASRIETPRRSAQATPRLSEDSSSNYNYEATADRVSNEVMRHGQMSPERRANTPTSSSNPDNQRDRTIPPGATTPLHEPQNSSRNVSRPPSILSNPIIQPSTQTVATSPEAKAPQEPVPEHWDDESLRAYLDGHGTRDVLDLLLVIRNKAPVRPVSRNHPIMVESGFQEHQKQLNAISAQLDGLLHAYMTKRARKGKAVSRT